MHLRLCLVDFCLLILTSLFVEPEDKAVVTLVTHFTQVIDDIVEDKWSHLPSHWVSEKNQKLYVISLDELKKLRTLNQDPQPFFLGYHRLGQKLFDLRLKVIQTF